MFQQMMGAPVNISNNQLENLTETQRCLELIYIQYILTG